MWCGLGGIGDYRKQEKKRKKKTSSRIGVVVGMVGCGTMQVGRGLHLHLHLHFACCFAGMCAQVHLYAQNRRLVQRKGVLMLEIVKRRELSNQQRCSRNRYYSIF